MSDKVDTSVPFDAFEEESMMKRPMYTDQHHSEFAFHRFSLLRAKNLLTDAVILSSDDKRCTTKILRHTNIHSHQKPPAILYHSLPYYMIK